jgi:hypothetical protein
MRAFSVYAIAVASFLAVFWSLGETRADEVAASPVPSWLDEARVGVFDHSAFDHNGANDEGSMPDGAFEILSKPLPFNPTIGSPWRELLNPRVNLGTTINFYGKTSVFYGGLVWRYPVVGPLFVEGQFGGALNNNPNKEQRNHLDIGCPATFREAAGVGWNINDHFDVIVSVEHISHAELCGHINDGLTNIGVKLGYKF